ncbi:hypothetical protein ACC740_36775, partial [Rhizobium ruizarguesonis]
AVNGYALSLWRPRGANLLFGLLMAGGLIPYQIFLYPMVRAMANIDLYNSLAGIILVHVIFGLLLDDALAHDGDAVGQRQGLDQVVGDVDHGVAEAL